MEPVIVIPAFSRARSLKRLLHSLNNAYYPNNNIRVIISIDGGAKDAVIKVANDFAFNNGTNEVIERETNLGLRNHILMCGDLTNIYGSVIILEDDLYVDPYFYLYAQAALDFYRHEDQIAGIALYSHYYNEYAKLPFKPIRNGFTGYFMQIACSWGQAWSKSQWVKFKNWYKKSDSEVINECLSLPESAKSWPESSWKKYFSTYLVKKKKYFYYPYSSYTTNCSDKGGVHIKNESDLHQVPLAYQHRKSDKLSFQKITSKSIRYDSFMEPDYYEFYRSIGFSETDLCVDMYGIKPIDLVKKKKYVLTSRKCNNFKKIFELKYKPIDNISLGETQIREENSRKLVYLSKVSDLINIKQPYYKLAKYYSFSNFESKSFLKGYFLEIVRKLLQKLCSNKK